MTEQIAGPQTEAAVAPTPPPVVAPPVLSDEQRALLRAALNRIVPASADMPAAGDLDVAASIERTLAANTRLRRLFLEGLADLAVARFVELAPDAQTSELRRLEQQKAAFLIALVEHTYRGYYTHPDVLERLNYGPPPQPFGRSLPAFDPELLAKQRAREPFWRRV